jgi:GDP-mannose 4,6-dehydratase
MKILITGITGMVGSHMVDYIIEQHPEHDIHGLLRWRSPLDNIAHAMPFLTLHHGDLRDLNSLVDVLDAAKPDWIYHLAAQSYVPFSFTAPAETLETNIIGTTNLLDAMRITSSDAKVHICSSSEVYGQVQKDEVPITENNPFRPASPYAVSKIGEDMIASQYFLSYGIRTVRTRMFTHTGPRRGDVFAESTFAKQIAEIEVGLRPNPVKVGNLDSVRTIADVRDAARAYWLLLEKCPAGEVYNIGGDQVLTVGDILEMLKGMATCKITHQVDQERLRPSDVTLQIPDSSRFREATGWRPEIPPEKTIGDLLDYHRGRLKRSLKGTQN